MERAEERRKEDKKRKRKERERKTKKDNERSNQEERKYKTTQARSDKEVGKRPSEWTKPYIDRNWRNEKIYTGKGEKDWYKKADKEKLPAQIVISWIDRRTSRREIYRELCRYGSIYDIALVKTGNWKRCFVTYDLKREARKAMNGLTNQNHSNFGLLNGVVANWAYREANGEQLSTGSSINISVKISENNQKRNRIIVEGVMTKGKDWKTNLLQSLKMENMIEEEDIQNGEIEDCQEIEEGIAMIVARDHYAADKIYLCRPENLYSRLTIKRRFNVKLRREVKDDKEWKLLKEEERDWKNERKRKREGKKW